MDPNVKPDSKLIKCPINPEHYEEGKKLPVGQSFDDDEYKMDHKRRGKAIIFNHYKYLDDYEAEREGSHEDVQSLEDELLALGFEVDIEPDKTFEEIQKKLKEVSEEDFTDADCLVVVAMSHGVQITQKIDKDMYPPIRHNMKKLSRQAILAYDKAYDENELFEFFKGDKCTSLRGKPKLFFIQACRFDGDINKIIPSKILTPKSDKTGEEKEIQPEIDYSVNFLPNDSDFFIFRSTVDGTVALRYAIYGSPFIQILCDELRKNRERGEQALDLESFSIDVRKKMAKIAVQMPLKELMPSANVSDDANVWVAQMPSVYTTLIRKLYLRPKED